MNSRTSARSAKAPAAAPPLFALAVLPVGAFEADFGAADFGADFEADVGADFGEDFVALFAAGSGSVFAAPRAGPSVCWALPVPARHKQAISRATKAAVGRTGREVPEAWVKA